MLHGSQKINKSIMLWISKDKQKYCTRQMYVVSNIEEQTVSRGTFLSWFSRIGDRILGSMNVQCEKCCGGNFTFGDVYLVDVETS